MINQLLKRLVDLRCRSKQIKHKRILNMPNGNGVYWLLILIALFTAQWSYGQDRSKLPNVVLIFMDDMGYGDLESYGGFPYKTPNLNKLAAEGMRFTNFYAAQATCTASRAALLTGSYPNRMGIHGAFMPWSPIALHPDEETIAEVLKAKGYKTGMVGKWHLGHKEPFLPLQQGFDEYLGLPYSNDMWPVDYDGKPITDPADPKSKYPPLPLYDGRKVVKIIESLEDQAELTSMYTDRACQFITQNKEQPFFLYIAQPMPHVPLAASQKFKGKSGAGLFGDVMEEIDWSVGEIVKTLEKQGLRENTLFIFTSDNGPWLRFGNHAGSAGGLREGKGTAWEGGVRVPFIVSWPGVIPEGTICNNMASTIDMMPTIVNICQARLPAKKIDGLDIWDLFVQKPGANPRNEFVYYYDQNSLKGIRMGKWKLVFPNTSQTYKKTARGADGWPGEYASIKVELALYDLSTDPGETQDLKEQYPDIVAKLTERADYYRETLGDDLVGKKGTERRPAAQVN